MAALTGSDISVDAAFAIHGTDATYTPPAGAAQDVTAIVRGANAMAGLLQTGAVRESTYALIRISEIAAPEEGAAISISDGEFAGDYTAGAPEPHSSGRYSIIPLNPPAA